MESFNIIRFYKHLKRDWHIFISIALVVTLIMAVVAFNSPDRYRSEVLVAPSAQGSSSALSGLASQLGGVASLAGVNLGGGGSDKTIEALETLKSKDFLIDFIEKYQLKIFLMGVDGWDIVKNTPIYNDEYDNNTNQWKRDIKFPKKNEPSLYEVSDYFLKHNLSISTLAETGYTIIEVEHFSPKLAKEIAENLVLEVNMKIREKDITASRSTLKFLNDALEKTNINELKQQIFTLMEQQLQTQMLAEVKEDYVFKVIDMPHEAEERFSPNRVLMCILGLILGLLFGFFISLTRFVVKEAQRAEV